MYAVLGFSALQLSKDDVSLTKTAQLFYTKCLANLIPLLAYEDAAADGRVLATTVILRMYEMQHRCKPHEQCHHA